MMSKPARLALFALLALTACGQKPKPNAVPPAVTVSRPLQKEVVDWDDFVGRFEAMDQVDVRPRVSGYLTRIGFKDGELVKKGQVLFEIEPRPYAAALDQAKAQAQRAEATVQNSRTALERGKTLLAARAISQEEFENRQAAERQAAADLAAAEANVRNAALNLGFTKVAAPLAGRVSDRKVAVGNLVNADSTVLTTLVSLDPIRFTFDGSEALYLKYQRDNRDGARRSSRTASNPVLIRLQDEAEYRWKGRMDFVDNALSSGTGTIRGRAVVDNPGAFLTPGMFGHLRLLGSAPYTALLVPDKAVQTDQTIQVLYVLGADGVVQQRQVDPGPVVGGLRVIESGLKPDDVVVIDGLTRVKPGDKAKGVSGEIRMRPPAPAENELASRPTPSASATVTDVAR
ncbi:MAG: efflux RND transporter periplasmic adaptor subunit [Caulobacteraceae bacterium]